MASLRHDPVRELTEQHERTEAALYRDLFERQTQAMEILLRDTARLVSALESEPLVGLLADDTREAIGNARYSLRKVGAR